MKLAWLQNMWLLGTSIAVAPLSSHHVKRELTLVCVTVHVLSSLVIHGFNQAALYNSSSKPV